MNKKSFIYKFLIDPKFRIWRHITLIVGFTIMSINQAIFGYKDMFEQLGNSIYLIVLIILATYIGSIYISLYILIPRFLIKRKYLIFGILFFLVAFLSVAIQKGMEYIVRVQYNSIEYDSEILILDNVSAFLVYLICAGGVTIPIFFKHWMISNQQVSQLEKNRISSEVEQLKEQINPDSLFNILNRTGVLAKTDPQKASAMVMKLSQLLRYQLYDCNREKVLLSSEITFITNFLELEKLYSSKFDYTITTERNIIRTFVPPLLFLPYVQCAVNSLIHTESGATISINLRVEDENMQFVIRISGGSSISSDNEELRKAKERMDFLYNKSYKLWVAENKGETEIMLELENKM